MNVRVWFCAAAVLSFATPALGQTRATPATSPDVPAKGMAAVGASIGVASPNDNGLNTGLDLGVTAEGYLSRRLSVRGEVSGAWFDNAPRGFTSGSVTPIALDANAVYNWEGGKIHPYVTGGVGLYRFRFTENGLDSHDTNIGIDLGGGAEYFLHRNTTVTGEILIHIVDSPVTSYLTTYDSHYWTVAVGVKRYF